MTYLYRSVLLCLLLAGSTAGFGQQQKYQGLLWEITGNKLPKPSYLFGTMHVSSKLAFHLSDSFYQCIRRADIVSLETDPEQLQEDFSKSSMLNISARYMDDLGGSGMSKDAFTIGPYGELIQTGLTYRPEMINHLLYRSFASEEDFEEDTFLDMYIYQVGKKLGKQATGVENFAESERLMLEAYRDAANDRKARKSNRGMENPAEARNKLNDAYRRGDLDMLDSISTQQYPSPAFLEKFLYKRNDNMFHVIDSIIRKASLFAGVGAAHLPGDRGLIHMLRKAGYTVRPIPITNRDSEQKEQLEKMKAPVVFQPYTSDDGWIQAEIPGKLYNFSNLTVLNQLQYADLANGAYYLVSRIRTNALSLGQSEDDVLLKVDSLLYENIPGKIIAKKAISHNGYKGFDIRNRTRRGDLQRYHIFATPFEVLIFKISGSDDYVDGPEAERFLSSIKIKSPEASAWKEYTSETGGFSIRLPHTPVEGNNVALRSMSKRQEYEAVDKTTGNSFMIIRKSIPEYTILEEDTADLSFAEESFGQSAFIKQQKSRKFTTWQGHPCLETVHQNNDNSYTQSRLFVKGPQYILLSARYKGDKKHVQEFFESFRMSNPSYKEFKQHKDTSLYFSVRTAVVPKDDESMISAMYGGRSGENKNHLYLNRDKVYRSDSTGEEIKVSFEKFNRYFSTRDSAKFWQQQEKTLTNNGDYVVVQQEYGPGSLLLQMRDTNTSRGFLVKTMVKHGAQYTIGAVIDTVLGPSVFIRTFFDSFTPGDSIFGGSIYESKSKILFADFFSKDSTTRQQARSSVGTALYNKEDAPTLISMIRGWSSTEKNYLEIKNNLIQELGYLRHADVLPFLRNAYLAANDTASLQCTILQSILQRGTDTAYQLFSELVLKEIPIFGDEQDIYSLTEAMNDSLELSASLFPGMLELTGLTDYKQPVYNLLAQLADSNTIKPEMYKEYVPQIAFDARIALQKELASEQEEEPDEEERFEPIYHVNYHLHNFAVLLLPYRQENKNAERFFTRYEQSRNPMQQIQLTQLYLRNGLPVSDSVLKSIAAQEKYRVDLWSALHEIGRLDKFPPEYNRQEAIARSVLYQELPYGTKLDSVVLLGKQHTTWQFKKGTVYFYKYWQRDDDTWFLAISGLQPDDEKKCNDDDRLTTFTEVRYQPEKTVQEQLTKILRHVKYGKRYRWMDDEFGLGGIMQRRF